jgi:hypothetical protein
VRLTTIVAWGWIRRQAYSSRSMICRAGMGSIEAAHTCQQRVVAIVGSRRLAASRAPAFPRPGMVDEGVLRTAMDGRRGSGTARTAYGRSCRRMLELHSFLNKWPPRRSVLPDPEARVSDRAASVADGPAVSEHSGHLLARHLVYPPQHDGGPCLPRGVLCSSARTPGTPYPLCHAISQPPAADTAATAGDGA